MTTLFTYLFAFIWDRTENNLQCSLSPTCVFLVSGIELKHPSLAANFCPPSHLTSPTTDSSPSSPTHCERALPFKIDGFSTCMQITSP